MVGRASVWSVHRSQVPIPRTPGPTKPSHVCAISDWISPWVQEDLSKYVGPSRPSQYGNTSGASIGVVRAPAGGRMTVHCEGDCRLLEQLGEKQDFEAELSRLGFRHQDFILHVLRQMSENQSPERNQNYFVTVTTSSTTAVSCTKAAAAKDGWRNSLAT